MRKRKEPIGAYRYRLIDQSNRFGLLMLFLLWVSYGTAGTNYRTTINVTYDQKDGPVTTFLNDPANMITITPTGGSNDTIFISDGDTLRFNNTQFDLRNFLLPVIIVIEDQDGSPGGGGMIHFIGGHSGLVIGLGSDIFVNPLNSDGLIYTNINGNGNAYGKPVILIGSNTILTVKDLAQVILVGSLSSFLPVEFISFHAQLLKERVLLEWQTAWERDNDYFEVQHSRDGSDFSTLSIVKGQGATAFQTHYQYVHAYPLPGIQYYRLKQVDFDASFTYSDIISVNYEGSTALDFTFSPNPAHHQIEVQLPQSPTQSLRILLANSLGQVRPLSFQPFGNNLQVELPADLPAGLYWLQVYNGKEKVAKPLSVQ